jgi:DNA polymerase-1
MPNNTYEYVTSQTVLDTQIIKDIAKEQILACDLETRGLDPRNDSIVSVQLGSQDYTWVLDARILELQALFDVLQETNPLFIFHNAKFDLKFLKHNYDFLPKRNYCTMLAFGILMNGLESPYVALNKLTKKHCGVELNKDVRNSFQYAYGELSNSQIKYAAMDVEYLHPIFNNQLDRLKSTSLVDVAKLEFSILPAVLDMELTGIALDEEKWRDLAEKKLQEVSNVEMQIAEFAGDVDVQTSFMNTPKMSINPRSPKQMLSLFKKYGIELDDTREDTLKDVDHELARLLLKHREVSKAATTYGIKFLEHVDSDGRIRSEYNQLGTVTGRFSSSSPNLQQVPHTADYRSCFIAGNGYKMITADYSQVELRAAAIISGEPAMLEIYSKDSADLHTETAALIYEIAPEQVSYEQRSAAKSVNFGVLYGISAYGLEKKFGIPQGEGEELIEGWHKVYPVLSDYMHEQSMLGLKQGYNTTCTGRRRYYTTPPLGSDEWYRKSQSVKRKAGNLPIQGSAADVMKQALCNVYSSIQKFDAHIVNTVHDELSVITPKEHLAETISTVLNEMQSAGEEIISPEMHWLVDLEYGDCWMKA